MMLVDSFVRPLDSANMMTTSEDAESGRMLVCCRFWLCKRGALARSFAGSLTGGPRRVRDVSMAGRQNVHLILSRVIWCFEGSRCDYLYRSARVVLEQMED